MFLYTSSELYIGDICTLLEHTRENMLYEHFVEPKDIERTLRSGLGARYRIGDGSVEVSLSTDEDNREHENQSQTACLDNQTCDDQYVSIVSSRIHTCDLYRLGRIHDVSELDQQTEDQKLICWSIPNGIYRAGANLSIHISNEECLDSWDYLPTRFRNEHDDLLDRVSSGELTYEQISEPGAQILANKKFYTLKLSVRLHPVDSIPSDYIANCDISIDQNEEYLDALFDRG